jgi:hypothetical protein
MSRRNRNRRSKSIIARIALEQLEGRVLLSDVQTAVLFKDIQYSQSSSGAPVIQSSDNDPYQSQADVVETSVGSVSSATVQEITPAVGAVTDLSSPGATDSPPAFTNNG